MNKDKLYNSCSLNDKIHIEMLENKEKEKEINECCICLDNKDIDNQNIVYILNNDKNKDICYCNINLHSECFFLWYKENNSCPICRNTINIDSLFFNNDSDFEKLNEINKEIENKLSLPISNELDEILSDLINNQNFNYHQYRFNRRNAIIGYDNRNHNINNNGNNNGNRNNNNRNNPNRWSIFSFLWR